MHVCRKYKKTAIMYLNNRVFGKIHSNKFLLLLILLSFSPSHSVENFLALLNERRRKVGLQLCGSFQTIDREKKINLPIYRVCIYRVIRTTITRIFRLHKLYSNFGWSGSSFTCMYTLPLFTDDTYDTCSHEKEHHLRNIPHQTAPDASTFISDSH